MQIRSAILRAKDVKRARSSLQQGKPGAIIAQRADSKASKDKKRALHARKAPQMQIRSAFLRAKDVRRARSSLQQGKPDATIAVLESTWTSEGKRTALTVPAARPAGTRGDLKLAKSAKRVHTRIKKVS